MGMKGQMANGVYKITIGRTTKMAGHDMSKMSATDRMAATDKMSMDDKAMMYDKMVAGKHLDKNDMKAMDAAAKMKLDEKMKMDKMKH